MRMSSARTLIIATAAVLALLPLPSRASAASPVLLHEFSLHQFDAGISAALGYSATASVVYFKELASLTSAQSESIRIHEPIGCFPFYVMRNGAAEESGFNCRSFFCVGYTRGPKQCRSTTGAPMSGISEISNRLSAVTLQDTQKLFADYPPVDRSEAMRKRIDELASVRCKPFYVLRFDIAVGEGYACDEIGQYPRYSGKFQCIEDWRTTGGKECSIPVRENELAIRQQILVDRGEYSSSASSSSASGSGSAVTAHPTSFPDVIQGYYGYTAITELARRGIIGGYPDGLYRPAQSLNRAEFSKLLVATLRPQELLGETGCFPDVGDEWYSATVCAAKRLGWLQGYPDGTFKPRQTMRKSEGIKVVVAALRESLPWTVVLDDGAGQLPIGVPENTWYTPYVRTAVTLQLLMEPSFNPAATVSRADAAVWLYRSLKASGALQKSSSAAPASSSSSTAASSSSGGL